MVNKIVYKKNKTLVGSPNTAADNSLYILFDYIGCLNLCQGPFTVYARIRADTRARVVIELVETMTTFTPTPLRTAPLGTPCERPLT